MEKSCEVILDALDRSQVETEQGGKLLTTKDLRDIFQVSEHQVWRFYHEGGLPYVYLGHKIIRFRCEDVVRWVREHLQMSA